jgi:multicomponent K+:H+ antiporter subunit D
VSSVFATYVGQHMPVLPVLLPFFTGVWLLAWGDGGADPALAAHKRAWARFVALSSVSLGLLVAIALVVRASGGELMVYRVGDWPAAYGVALLVDRLSAMMLLLTSLVAWPVLWYASAGWDARGRHFHAIFQFQLMGLHGAFVTADLFNLFVFFEVLLVASYALALHGLGRERLRAGLHYVVMNLTASALFLVGVALLYGKVGTLNLADLAVRVPQIAAPDNAIVHAGGLILLVVFGFKAALLPLSMWLPATYSAAGAPVAALFAIMTKVGVYAIVRVHGGVFAGDAATSAQLVPPVLLTLALATSLIGVLGAMAAHTLERLVSWLTVASVGTVLAAIGLSSEAAWSAAFYYMANSTLVVAALFLLAEVVALQRGDAADRLEPASAVAQPALLGVMLLLAAASATGVPPLPGFIGKLMLLEAAASHRWQAAVWTVVLLVSFLTMIGLARAGSILFWHVRDTPDRAEPRAAVQPVAATWMLLAATVVMSVWAAPIQSYVSAAATQLGEREAYARAMLGPLGSRTSTTRGAASSKVSPPAGVRREVTR